MQTHLKNSFQIANQQVRTKTLIKIIIGHFEHFNNFETFEIA